VTSEELDLEKKEVNDQLVEFSKPGVELTNKQWRLQVRLNRELILLDKIKKARENKNSQQEINLTAQYNIQKEGRSRHPILDYIMQLKMRSHVWW
jgi:hypothetical protein